MSRSLHSAEVSEDFLMSDLASSYSSQYKKKEQLIIPLSKTGLISFVKVYVKMEFILKEITALIPSW